jgi:hypothetical protein
VNSPEERKAAAVERIKKEKEARKAQIASGDNPFRALAEMLTEREPEMKPLGIKNVTRITEQDPAMRRQAIADDRERVRQSQWKTELERPFELGGAL